MQPWHQPSDLPQLPRHHVQQAMDHDVACGDCSGENMQFGSAIVPGARSTLFDFQPLNSGGPEFPPTSASFHDTPGMLPTDRSDTLGAGGNISTMLFGSTASQCSTQVCGASMPGMQNVTPLPPLLGTSTDDWLFKQQQQHQQLLFLQQPQPQQQHHLSPLQVQQQEQQQQHPSQLDLAAHAATRHTFDGSMNAALLQSHLSSMGAGSGLLQLKPMPQPAHCQLPEEQVLQQYQQREQQREQQQQQQLQQQLQLQVIKNSFVQQVSSRRDLLSASPFQQSFLGGGLGVEGGDLLQPPSLQPHTQQQQQQQQQLVPPVLLQQQQQQQQGSHVPQQVVPLDSYPTYMRHTFDGSLHMALAQPSMAPHVRPLSIDESTQQQPVHSKASQQQQQQQQLEQQLRELQQQLDKHCQQQVHLRHMSDAGRNPPSDPQVDLPTSDEASSSVACHGRTGSAPPPSSDWHPQQPPLLPPSDMRSLLHPDVDRHRQSSQAHMRHTFDGSTRGVFALSPLSSAVFGGPPPAKRQQQPQGLQHTSSPLFLPRSDVSPTVGAGNPVVMSGQPGLAGGMCGALVDVKAEGRALGVTGVPPPRMTVLSEPLQHAHTSPLLSARSMDSSGAEVPKVTLAAGAASGPLAGEVPLSIKFPSFSAHMLSQMPALALLGDTPGDLFSPTAPGSCSSPEHRPSRLSIGGAAQPPPSQQQQPFSIGLPSPTSGGAPKAQAGHRPGRRAGTASESNVRISDVVSKGTEKLSLSHSCIEKQRRDRINSLIDELRLLVPPTTLDENGGTRRAKHIVLADTLAMIKNIHRVTPSLAQGTGDGESVGAEPMDEEPAGSPDQEDTAALGQGNSPSPCSTPMEEMGQSSRPLPNMQQRPLTEQDLQARTKIGLTVIQDADGFCVQVFCRDRPVSEILNALSILPIEVTKTPSNAANVNNMKEETRE